MSDFSRRGFVGLLAGFASTAVLDPEKALWVSGRRTHFIPKATKFEKAVQEVTAHYRLWLNVGTKDAENWVEVGQVVNLNVPDLFTARTGIVTEKKTDVMSGKISFQIDAISEPEQFASYTDFWNSLGKTA